MSEKRQLLSETLSDALLVVTVACMSRIASPSVYIQVRMCIRVCARLRGIYCVCARLCMSVCASTHFFNCSITLRVMLA